MEQILGFGERLKDLMKSRGYSNATLTKELGVSKNAVGNYQNNQVPNATILYKMSQILGTNMEYLLTGKEGNELTVEEKKLLEAYRSAAPAMQEAARKILDVPDLSGKSSISEPGKQVI